MYMYMYSVPSGYSTYMYTNPLFGPAWTLIINTQAVCMDAASLVPRLCNIEKVGVAWG